MVVTLPHRLATFTEHEPDRPTKLHPQQHADVGPGVHEDQDNASVQHSGVTSRRPPQSSMQDDADEEEVLAVGPFNFSRSRLDAMARSDLANEQLDGNNPTNQPGSDRSKAARKALLNAGKQSTSQYKGVNRHSRSNRWEAHIWDGRQLHLGCFDDELQAAAAYDIVALKLRGVKAGLNFPVRHYEEELQSLPVMPLEQLVTMVRASRRNQIITNRLRARRRSSGASYCSGDNSLPLFSTEAANDPRPRPLRLNRSLSQPGTALPSDTPWPPTPTGSAASAGWMMAQQRPRLPAGSGASPVKKRRPSFDVFDSLVPPVGSHPASLSSSPVTNQLSPGSHSTAPSPSPTTCTTSSSLSHSSHAPPPRRSSFRRHSVASYAPSPDPSALPLYQFQSRSFEPLLPPIPSYPSAQQDLNLDILMATAADHHHHHHQHHQQQHQQAPAANGVAGLAPPCGSFMDLILSDMDPMPSLGAPGNPWPQPLTANPSIEDLRHMWQQQQHLLPTNPYACSNDPASSAHSAPGASAAASAGGMGGIPPQLWRALLWQQQQRQHLAVLPSMSQLRQLPSAAHLSGGLSALASWPPVLRNATDSPQQVAALNLMSSLDMDARHPTHLLHQLYVSEGAQQQQQQPQPASSSSATTAAPRPAWSRRSPFLAPAAADAEQLPSGQAQSSAAVAAGSSNGQSFGSEAAAAAPPAAGLEAPAAAPGAPAEAAAPWGLGPLAETDVELLEVMMTAAAQIIDKRNQTKQQLQQQLQWPQAAGQQQQQQQQAWQQGVGQQEQPQPAWGQTAGLLQQQQQHQLHLQQQQHQQQQHQQQLWLNPGVQQEQQQQQHGGLQMPSSWKDL